MTQLRVVLNDTVGDRRLSVKLPDDVPLEQLVPVLARKLGLPEGDYALTVEGAAPLAAEVTLAGAGVSEGATLRLEQAVPEAPPAEPAPPSPAPSPAPVAPAAPKAGLPAWAWALGGVVLLGAALAVGMLAIGQVSERKAATAMAQARATEQAAATATAQTQATEQAVATATAQAWATEQAAASATTQAQAAEQAAATATAQARATEQAAATETAQAQASKQAPAASTATASAQSPSEAPSHWPIVFSDSFGASENGWPTGDYNYDQVTLEIRITNGKYRVEAIAHKEFTLWATHPMDFIPDFHLTAEARQVSGPEIRAFGLVFRLTDGDNYGFFGISDDQQFVVRIKHQGEWTRPIDWTETTTIQPGEMNRLTVVAEGSHYLFFINDQKVGEVVDNLLSSGKAGFGLELDAGETAVFEFDDFELRAP